MNEINPSIFDTKRRPRADLLEDDEAARSKHATDVRLGNIELPIATYREKIVAAVNTSQATVITAETGAGKSTQVPQFLAEAGYEVVVTQPRVVAARTVAERVRDEIVARKGDGFADFVGYRTACEGNDSENNQILFATDGLQLVRELSGHGVGRKQALVLDEVHEWNENMEVLVAWSKRRMAEDPDFRVVMMSATMEAGPLSRFLSRDGTYEVPVIEVPGRTFEVKKSEGGDVADQAAQLAKEGKNILVFVPGKAEIADVMAQIERQKIPGVTVLPLHGKLEPADQRKVFQKYDGAKVIVATNVAQTSITIDDIDVVVDSGLERRNEVKNGVEGLYLRPVSQADCLQRAGRAGRTKKGEYVLAQLGNNQLVPFAEREAYGTPEILRSRLEGTTLCLAKNGFDASELEFYHQPDYTDINSAKTRLQKLGALTENGEITPIGKAMERMPLESHYARMMIEARKYDPELQTQLVALLATQQQEVGGITLNGRGSVEAWRRLTSGSVLSDGITQLEVFINAQQLSAKEQRDHDIVGKNLSKAQSVMRQLRGVEKLKDIDLTLPNKEQQEQLVRCIVSGMVDHLYTADGYGRYSDAEGDTRETSNRSTIRSGGMIVGTPFNLQIKTRDGSRTLKLIEGITNIPSIEMLREIAPQLFNEERVGFELSETGTIVELREAIFNNLRTGQYVRYESEPSEQRRDWLVETLCSVYGQPQIQKLKQLREDLAHLQTLTPEILPTFTSKDVRDLLLATIPIGASTLQEAAANIPEIDLTYLINSERIDEIRAASPHEFRGMSLEYRQGVPVAITDNWTIEQWMMLGDNTSLPDGRQICTVGGYYEIKSIAERKTEVVERYEAQARLVREESERLALQERQRRAEAALESSIERCYEQTYVDMADLSEQLIERVFGVRNELDALRTSTSEITEREKMLTEYHSAVGTLLSDIHRYEEGLAEGITEDLLSSLKGRFNS